MSRTDLREAIGETSKKIEPSEIEKSGSVSPVEKANAAAKVNNFMEEPGIAVCIKSTNRASAAADFSSAISSPKKQIAAQVNRR